MEVRGEVLIVLAGHSVTAGGGGRGAGVVQVATHSPLLPVLLLSHPVVAVVLLLCDAVVAVVLLPVLLLSDPVVAALAHCG